MPGFDRSGPMGAGPMTGRGLGRCTPQGRQMLAGGGYGAGYGFGRGGGRGFGRGGGRGWGRGFGYGAGYGPGYGYGTGYGGYAPFGYGPAAGSLDDERSWLEAEAAALKEHLTNLEQRLSELEKAEEKD